MIVEERVERENYKRIRASDDAGSDKSFHRLLSLGKYLPGDPGCCTSGCGNSPVYIGDGEDVNRWRGAPSVGDSTERPAEAYEA